MSKVPTLASSSDSKEEVPDKPPRAEKQQQQTTRAVMNNDEVLTKLEDMIWFLKKLLLMDEPFAERGGQLAVHRISQKRKDGQEEFIYVTDDELEAGKKEGLENFKIETLTLKLRQMPS